MFMYMNYHQLYDRILVMESHCY